MKVLIGSYNKGINELEILNNKINNIKQISDADKASYINNFKDSYIYIYMKDNLQYLFVDNQHVLLNEGACHLSYDSVNELIYVSFYGAGLLKVVKNINGIWTIFTTLSYGKDSKVHYAEYITNLNLVGLCDLGLNIFRLYKVVDSQLVENTNFSFNNNEGPRHFTFHKTLPIIYIVNELKPSVIILEYKNNELILLDNIELDNGYGSAIRLDKNDTTLFAAVRDSNILYSFKVLKNGLLEKIQKVHTEGDHPRDFNLIYDDKYLLVANMKSDNLSLFLNDKGKLTLLEKNYSYLAGCTIL